MQPYTGYEPLPEPAPTAQQAAPKSVRPIEDIRNLALIAAGWIIVLLILPPQHEYPIIDDWIYAGSVHHMLDTGRFTMPIQSQANLVGLSLWGAAWAKLFGLSYTTLTYSTLFMSFVALFSFYGVARSVGTSPWAALLGTGFLAYNPIFVHLSYSFMTDVPFVALMLLSCLCYIRGLRGHGRLWFWVGGFLAGWSFLIRQFGALIPIAFLLPALYGLVNKKLRPRDLVEVLLPAGIIISGWFIWSQLTPFSSPPSRPTAFVMREPWLRVILLRSLILLPVIALSAWAAIKIRRARWWLVVVAAVVVLLVLFNVDLPSEEWVQSNVADYVARIGPLSINFSRELYTFGDNGNIIRVTGIDFFEYAQQAVLSPEFWHLLWIAGLALGTLFLAKIGDGLLDWLRDYGRKRSLSPAAGLYLLGAAIFIVSVALPNAIFDRYMFTVLPFVLLFVVRGSAAWGRIAWVYSIAALALVFTFTMLAKADNIDHDNARWQAGEWMLARAGAVHVGFDFNNLSGHPSSDTYILADSPQTNYRVEQRFSYFSRLGGFSERYVYALSHVNAPPLPRPSPGPTPPK